MQVRLPLFFSLLLLYASPGFAQKPKPYPRDSSGGNFVAVAAAVVEQHVPVSPQSVQSPNAASLGAYGEINVSPFTGKPQVNIDLHSVSDGNVTLPISLLYDASGVRPDIHGGWVGLNFNLSTNYSVIRTVRDGPDEGQFGSPAQAGYLAADVRTLLNFNSTDWASTANLDDVAFNANGYDSETDEYSFNAPGVSGKFYMGQDGNWKVQCDKAVKVELISSIVVEPPFTPPYWTQNPWWNYNGKYLRHVSGFYITDEQGTKYEFGGTTAYNEYSMDFFNQGKDTWICNAWYLRSITRSTGQVINFTYERGNFVAQMFFSVYNMTSRMDAGSDFSCSNWSSLIGSYGAYNGKLISPIYLKEISAANFKVKFTSNESNELPYTADIFSTWINKNATDGVDRLDYLTYLYDCFYPVNNHSLCNNPAESISQLLAKLKWRKLDKIQVQDGSGTTIKEFGFTYNNVATERLMLQKVQEKSGDASKLIPPYEFTYNTDVSLTLPAYCKTHTDHWGYNNARLINVATDFNAYASYGNTYRIPPASNKHYLLGTLTQIKYPTGGFTKLWMEPHTYAKAVQQKRWLTPLDSYGSNQTAGGLRVKEIHSCDPNISGSVVKKKYYYLASFNPASPDTSATALSSGVLGGKAEYYWADYRPKPEDPSIVVSQQIFSSQSVLPASENTTGSHIGYSNVVEWQSTEGWTVHKFTNFDNGYMDTGPTAAIQVGSTAYQPYNSNAFKRGKLFDKQLYSNSGSLRQGITYSYAEIGTQPEYSARAVRASVVALCNTFHYVYEGTAYVVSTQKFLPSEETRILYDQEDASKSSLSASLTGYKPNGQVSLVYTTDSKTSPTKVNVAGLGLLYNRQKEVSYKYANDFSDAVSIAMKDKNMISMPLEVTMRMANVSGSSLVFTPLNYVKTTYMSAGGILVPTIYVPSKVESRQFSASSLTTDMEFLTYDGRGNLLSYKDRGGITSTLEYYGTGDIGKTDLIKKKTVQNGDALAQATSYDYKPGIGVQSITDPNAKAIQYDYDGLNRLQTIKNPSGLARVSYCYNYVGQVVDCVDLAPTGSIAASTLVLIAPNPLPVTLVAFDAKRAEPTEGVAVARLTWSTTTETQSDRFEIERSADGKQWSKLGTVAASGESTDTRDYSFSDQWPLKGENLYRLKMIDMDGTFAYSRIRSVLFDGQSVSLYPNPVTIGSTLNLLTDDPDKISSIRIYNSQGKLMQQSAVSKQINTTGLSAGLYMVQITYTDGSITTHRVVKQ